MHPNTKHGHATRIDGNKHRTSEYTCWAGMKHRCANPNYRAFARYGGRGIKVCDRWAASFEAFLADMGPKPNPRDTLDRINVDGDYEPGNCRWASWKVQQGNRGFVTTAEAFGYEMVLPDWAALSGIPYTTLRWRLRHGWMPELALTTAPAQGRLSASPEANEAQRQRVMAAVAALGEKRVAVGRVLELVRKGGDR
jgi:hypothetical protein